MSIFDQIKRQADALAAEQTAAAKQAATRRREHIQRIAADGDAEDKRERSNRRQRERYAQQAHSTIVYAATVDLDPDMLLPLFGDSMPQGARYQITAAPARHALSELLPKYYCQRYKVCTWFCKDRLAEVGLCFAGRVDVRLLAAIRWLYNNRG
jgi:hypothetical protein